MYSYLRDTTLAANADLVIKPHGSCSFLPYMPGIMEGVVFKDNVCDIQTQTRVVRDPASIDRWCLDSANASFAPAMSFYASGKDTKVNRDMIDRHRAAWLKLAEQGDICFVIGVACNPEDRHIWDAIRDSRHRLIYVNPSDGGFQQWLDATGRKFATRWPMGFEDAIPKLIAESR